MKMWSRGRLLMTREVKKLSKDRQAQLSNKERCSVYTNFSSSDQGRARKQVCWVNPDHPDFEENMDLISHAAMNEANAGLYKRWYGDKKDDLIVANRVLKIWRTMFMILALLTTFVLVIIS